RLDGIHGEVEKALEGGPEPGLQRTWEEFAPTGLIDFEAAVERVPGHIADIDLTVYPKGCNIEPAFFRYTLSDLVGRLHYAKHWVELEKLSARHGDSVISLGTGLVYLKPGGGVWADLHDIRGRPLLTDAAFVQALPPPLRRACTALDVRGPVGLDTRLVIDT